MTYEPVPEQCPYCGAEDAPGTPPGGSWWWPDAEYPNVRCRHCNRRYERERVNLEFTDTPICPYCSTKEMGAWEINFGAGLEGSTEICCGECGRDYGCERSVIVSYTSYLVKKTEP